MKNRRHIIKTLGQQYAACKSGVAAIEFALLLPVLLLLFFGVLEGADMLSQSRRVAQAVNTVTDLASQETNLMHDDVDDLFTGVEQIAYTRGSPIEITLVSVIADPSGDPMVHWSRDNTGAQPYSPGAPYTGLSDAALLDDDASIIVGEIKFPYTSKLSQFIFDTINFEETATRWPRRSMQIELCSAPGACTSASSVTPPPPSP